jgi:hypothetical protein
VSAAAAPVLVIRTALRRSNDQKRIERWAYRVGALLMAEGALHLLVALIYPRPWLGPLSWRKPITFGTSFGLTLIAITWVASYLRLSDRARTILVGVFAVDCVVEVGGITVQAWRHVPSHLNNTTPLNAVIAFSLAFGGGVLIVVLGALAVTAFRGRIDAPPSMRLALRAGFALLLAGLASGAAMIARGEILIKQGHRAQAYSHAGFLKWPHAVTLHAVLVLPLLAWWLAHASRTPRTEAQRTRVVATAAATYVVAAVGALAVSLILAR